MTLVFDRTVAGPKTHAFVIGCGRFAHLAVDAERAATAAGARAVVRFLVDHADDFVAPLATVECLISDPGFAPGQDSLGLGALAHDPRADDAVASATSVAVDAAGMAWVNRCSPGDHMVFYLASHGVVDRDQSAIGVLEDVNASPRRPWVESFNVTMLAMGLRTIQAGGCWVFLDACQEIVAQLINQPNGAQGIALITPSITDLARKPVMTLALAGSRFGGKAWAPTNGDPPFFTQALLRGLGGASVEPFSELGWAVTGRQLLFSLSDIANAALDYTALEVEPLSQFNQQIALLKVAAPKVPVCIRTEVEGHILQASQVSASDGNGRTFVKADGEMTWRFELDPDHATYTARAQFQPGGPTYVDKAFPATPPAQIVVLTQ